MRKIKTGIKILLLFFLFQLTGCATYATMMRHPETKDIYPCSSYGVGIPLMILASSVHSKCVERFEEQGYVPVNLGEQGYVPVKDETKE